jgi:hypothetical protein
MTRESPTPMVPDAADRALQAFVEQPVPPMSAADARDLRGRVLARMGEVQSRGWRERKLRSWAMASIASAAAVGLVGAALWRSHRTAPSPVAEVVALEGPSAIEHAGGERPLEEPGRTDVGPSDELRTGPQSRASAVLATGAAVDVGPGSRLRFLGGQQPGHLRDQVNLLVGKIDVQVPKLQDGDELRVVTDEATVVVHGTRFSVERTAADAGHIARTRVAVLDGRVAVLTLQGERMLTGGADWISALSEESSASPGPVPVATAGSIRSPSPSADGLAGGRFAADGASTLKSENAALAEAMRLIRENLDAQALARLDNLLARHPSTPLAETARYERVLVLHKLGSPRLKHEAERYLADYPNGVAREDVTQWLSSPPKPAP